MKSSSKDGFIQLSPNSSRYMHGILYKHGHKQR